MPQYFKKSVFKQRVVFSNGAAFDGFERVGQDEGVLVTDDPSTIKELEANIRARRGGVEKITAQDYLALQSKKKEPLKRRWREEFNPRRMPLEQSLARRALRAVPAVADANPAQPAQLKAPPASSEAAFRPSTTTSPPAK